MVPKKGGRLSNKQKALIKGIAQGKSIHGAAIDAGYSERQAKSKVYNMVARPAFQSKIQALMEESGFTDSHLLDGLRDALAAVKADGTPDHPVRLRALELSFKLKGSYAPTRSLKGNVSFDLSEILKAAQNEE